MRQAVMKPAAGVQVKAGMRTRSEKTHVSLEAKDVVLRWGISAGSHGGVNPVRIVMKAFSAQLKVFTTCLLGFLILSCFPSAMLCQLS